MMQPDSEYPAYLLQYCDRTQWQLSSTRHEDFVTGQKETCWENYLQLVTELYCRVALLSASENELEEKKLLKIQPLPKVLRVQAIRATT